jgi:archaellum component FlaF (FlaF/FlaG flagellin family)
VTFASTTVGSTTAAQTVTLTNSGTATLDITSIAVGGTDATSFLISAKTCTTTLAAAASCTFSVEFKPAATGALTGDIAITDNAAASPQKVTLAGTGAAAAAPAVSLSATSLTFASTTVGSTTTAQTVTLKNTGTATLDITSIAVGGTDETSFLIPAKTCTTTLAAAASCTFSVEFKPAATGALTGDIAITDNATGSPQKVTLAGTGAAASTGLTLSPTSLTFASTAAGNTSEAQAVTLKNGGTTTVTLKSITITGTNATSFLDLSACGASLAESASCTVLVSFKPTAAGTLKGDLSISSSASTTAQTVPLTGTATAEPTLKLSVTSITFAATAPGATSEATMVTLTNSGTTTATIDDIVLGGADPADFEELNTCGATLAAAGTCSIYVSFKPAAADSYTGSVLIYDNAAASPQTITLSGKGD